MKKKTKQIAAWICILLIVALYAFTFIVALLDFPGSEALFQSCLVATIVLPILLWIYIWIFQKVKERKTQGNPDCFHEE